MGPGGTLNLAKIKLSKGYFAIVDDEDLEILFHYYWHVSGKRNLYARTSLPRINTTILMHRLISRLHYTDKRNIDHINHNSLDNRKKNLRIATCSQNSANRRPEKNNTSKYKGVTRNSGRWLAQIQTKGKNHNLGRYDIEEEAAKAYDSAALRLFGEFAFTNF